MRKTLLYLLLILPIVSCKKIDESNISEEQLQNKTFTLLNKNKKDHIVIEFQDSTYQIFGNKWEGNIPWKLNNYDGANLLILGTNVIGIKKTGKDTFECENISLAGRKFILSERETKWDKNLIFGTWIRKQNNDLYDYSLNDSVSKPNLPPLPDGYSEKDFKSFPFYEITRDSIKLYQSYYKYKSKIKISNTSEYLLMELENNVLNQKEWEWRIKKLNSEFMIIEKTVWTSFGKKFLTDTLIKKR